MRDTVLTEGCLGPFEHAKRLRVGDTQSFTFKNADIGPWYLSPEEREAQKIDQLTLTIDVPNTNPELLVELQEPN